MKPKESSMQEHYEAASTYGGGAGSRPYTQTYSNLNAPADTGLSNRNRFGLPPTQHQLDMDAMFEAAEKSKSGNTPNLSFPVPSRDTGKINVSMGFASTDPDQSSLRKDKFKSRIGGIVEEPTLNVSSSKLSTNAGIDGSLNSNQSKGIVNHLTT